MNQMPAVVGELVTRWRKDAVAREPLGSARAEVYRSCAAQLESTLSALTAEAGKGEGVVVDDLMVERARKAYHSTIGAAQVFCPKCGGTGRDRDNYNECEKCEGNRWIWPEGAPDPMRAALEAALSTATPAGECAACNGAGEVETLTAHTSGDPQDAYVAPATCPVCDGNGGADPWMPVSSVLPMAPGWYIGINYGAVEPLRWDGNSWHHSRVTRDLAMPSHWRTFDSITRPLAASTRGASGEG
jgi:hypothetical protein